ncbi:hypothetical protein HETIRDRAFT_103973 [Heterobasidion irregulare TC 32-1]|uniref:Integrase catalytic domain-containing protein n=1 Tax=Heterobasidion irregulare (strain TC 32-1) TaxID=747525 RepID=W4JYF0_HETIT|nr:uncharacterized protein HETIRDRAFT_103973 [Heterobasidion irregulare TC 32-1]ETW78573.1 hypothetical protein HETIRDRAFT_103973 [Heterobasidion irregulare TC 32-1]
MLIFGETFIGALGGLVDCAAAVHGQLHFGRNHIKLQLLDTICSPQLDQSIVTALANCAPCKNFRGMHLYSILEPITRCRPFELLVADYLSLPKGTNGFHTVGLYLDTYFQCIWGFKYKTHSTAKTTISGLTTITTSWTKPNTFMTDGVIAAYSAWVNGLVEGTNKILLGRLKRLCSPELGEDECTDVKPEDIPKNWPKYFDQVIEWLNNCILPALHHSPNELALGLVINTPKASPNTAEAPPSIAEVERQLAYTEQQRLNGYAFTVDHAHKRKAAFNRRVVSAAPAEVIFARFDLVQVYRNALDFTLFYSKQAASQMVTPPAHPSRRLKKFVPRSGTKLAQEQATLLQDKEGHPKEDGTDGPIFPSEQTEHPLLEDSPSEDPANEDKSEGSNTSDLKDDAETEDKEDESRPRAGRALRSGRIIH